MKIILVDLEAHFVRFLRDQQGRECQHHTERLCDAQGVAFLCPACFESNNGPRGTHSVVCVFQGRGVPSEVLPKIARWNVLGTGIADLSLSPSIHLAESPCNWHGFIQNGVAS